MCPAFTSVFGGGPTDKTNPSMFPFCPDTHSFSLQTSPQNNISSDGFSSNRKSNLLFANIISENNSARTDNAPNTTPDVASYMALASHNLFKEPLAGFVIYHKVSILRTIVSGSVREPREEGREIKLAKNSLDDICKNFTQTQLQTKYFLASQKYLQPR